MEHEFLSLLPPLAAISLALTIRKIIPSLFCGIFIGALMLAKGHLLTALLETFEKYIIPSLGSPWNATVVIYGAFFGGLINLLNVTGGAKALGDFFKQKAKTKRKAEIWTAIMGLMIFFDDYFNCLTVGSVMRPVAHKMKISKEKLSYIIDSTAAPICLLVPISTWVIFVVGLIGQYHPESPFNLYLKTIPYNFYAFIALILVFLFILFPKLNFGPMKKRELELQKTPLKNEAPLKIQEKENAPIYNLFAPLIVMVITLLFLFLYTGGYFASENPRTAIEAMGNSKGAFSVLIAVFCGGMTSLIIGYAQKIFKLSVGFEFYISGMKNMITTYIILILAWGMGGIIKDLGTAMYVSSFLKMSFSPLLIPAIIFFIGAFISFTTGTAYGTYAIIIPLVFQIHGSLSIPLPLLLGSALSGGIFGDHCSPLSDTTILASAGADCDLVDHVATQLPYALLGGLTAAFLFFLATII